MDSIITERISCGTQQQEAITNIKRFIELQDEINLLVIARPTVTILNIYHLPETLEWLDQHNIRHNATHLTHPTHMSVTVLPSYTKQMILDKFENYDFKNENTRKSCQYITNYMNSVDNSNLLGGFGKYTNFYKNKF